MRTYKLQLPISVEANISEANVKQSGQSQKNIKLQGGDEMRLPHESQINSTSCKRQASAPPAPALRDAVSVRYMYHDPCHSPMKTYQPLKVVNELMGVNVPLNERCCGEAGSFGVSLPQIATQVRFRKEEEMRKGADALRADGLAGEIRILTSCPACHQGLSRYNDDSGTTSEYVVIEMARHLLGPDWLESYVSKANHGGIERVLL